MQLLPSMSTHKLPSIATSIDGKLDHSSLAVHRCTPYTEEDTDSFGETGIINSMVAHQISVEETISDVNTKEELKDYAGEQENNNLPFFNSMIYHQLPQFEIPDELPEFMISSVSHGFISIIDQHDKFESDPGLLTTMIVHQKSIETENVNNIGLQFNDYWEFYEPVNEVLISIEETETETYFLPSMYTHHLSTVDTPIEMSNNLATMVVHTTDQSWTVNTNVDESAFESDPGMITSMLSHHVTTEIQCLHSSQKQELIELLPQMLGKSNDPKDIHFNDLPYFVSMVSHHVPYRDTPIEFGSCIISAACHGLMLMEQQEDNLWPSTSMVAHLQNMDSYNQSPVSSECFMLDFVRDIIENENNSKETNHCDESSMYKTESGVDIFIQEDKSSTSDSSHTSMVAHQIMASVIPNELLDYFTSSTAHRINGESQEYKELISDRSMLVHKISDIKQEDIEYDQIINQTKFFNDYMEEEKDDYIPVNVCTQETYKEVNSSTNKEIQVESHIPFIETNKYVPNIEVDAKTVDTYDISSVVAKEAHIANNDLKLTTRHLGNNEEGQDNWENNICQDERPVELNEDLIVSASCDNFVSEEQNNENDIVICDFDSKLTNVRELHKIVEDEIGELENKRNNNSSANENNVKITETCIVSNVKGVEIKSCFTFHQLNKIEDTEYLTSDSKDISLEANRETCFSIREDNNSENKEEDEKMDTHSNASCTNSRENLVHASCTIENNHPVIITACNLQLNSEDLQSQSTRNDINEGNAIDHAAEENGQIKDLNEETLNNNDYIFNDLKQHLRRTPRIYYLKQRLERHNL